MPVETHKLC